MLEWLLLCAGLVLGAVLCRYCRPQATYVCVAFLLVGLQWQISAAIFHIARSDLVSALFEGGTLGSGAICLLSLISDPRGTTAGRISETYKSVTLDAA